MARQLLAIRGELFWYFREVVSGWAREDVTSLLTAKVKQLTWAELEPLKLTTRERELATHLTWPALVFDQSQAQNSVGYPTLTAPQYALMELQQRIARDFKVNRAVLKREVSAALQSCAGKPVTQDGAKLFWVYFPEYDLTVETTVDWGRPLLGQMMYQHTVFGGHIQHPAMRADINRLSASAISVCNLLGSYAPTTWNMLEDGDTTEACTLLVGFVKEFLGAFPHIASEAQKHAVRPSLGS